MIDLYICEDCGHVTVHPYTNGQGATQCTKCESMESYDCLEVCNNCGENAFDIEELCSDCMNKWNRFVLPCNTKGRSLVINEAQRRGDLL